jgi:undecaprenyl-diphosphatase
MTIWEAFLLGLLQGLTEFIPVSSSGHLVMLQKYFGITEGMTFDVMVHFGTLLAVFFVFWQDILKIIKQPLGRFPLLLLAGAVPTAIIFFAFSDFFINLFQTGKWLGVGFVITGLILWKAETMPSGKKNITEMSILDAVFIGIMQGIAIVPGISRSGATIAGGLFRGLNREFAARYSFMLSAPIIFGATLLEIKDLPKAENIDLLPLVIGTVTAAASGYLAIRYMLRVMTQGRLRNFSYYVWFLALIVFIDQLFYNHYFPPLF